MSSFRGSDYNFAPFSVGIGDAYKKKFAPLGEDSFL